MVRISADDSGLWRRAMRDVAPLPGRSPRRADPDRRHHAGDTAAIAFKTPPLPPMPSRPLPPLDGFAGVDRATADRIRRGRYPVAGRLDLHGMTQDEAHRALAHFIGAARARGQRCVLVITGHGRLSGGVLKAAVPRWLAEPGLRPHVLAIAPARPPHGGSGALYVLLRRAAN